jgi:hypothetical protein
MVKNIEGYCFATKPVEYAQEEKETEGMMKEGIASYLASPQGMETIQTYISLEKGAGSYRGISENTPGEADGNGSAATGTGYYRLSRR